MQEIWKDIKNFENIYQISNFGNIRNKKTNKLRKPVINSKYGHLIITLYDKNNRKPFLIHRLVAETFLSNPENKPCVDHIDTNPQNNNVNNLRWCTYLENSLNELTKIHNNLKIIIQYDKNNNYIKEYRSARYASLQTGIASSNISRCCRGITKHAGGYIWKYKN